jgi:hypothetical protein
MGFFFKGSAANLPMSLAMKAFALKPKIKKNINEF